MENVHSLSTTNVVNSVIKKIFLIYLFYFLSALGLCYCMQAFSSCGQRELLFIAVHGLLTEVASLVEEPGL